MIAISVDSNILVPVVDLYRVIGIHACSKAIIIDGRHPVRNTSVPAALGIEQRSTEWFGIAGRPENIIDITSRFMAFLDT